MNGSIDSLESLEFEPVPLVMENTKYSMNEAEQEEIQWKRKSKLREKSIQEKNKDNILFMHNQDTKQGKEP